MAAAELLRLGHRLRAAGHTWELAARNSCGQLAADIVLPTKISRTRLWSLAWGNSLDEGIGDHVVPKPSGLFWPKPGAESDDQLCVFTSGKFVTDQDSQSPANSCGHYRDRRAPTHPNKNIHVKHFIVLDVAQAMLHETPMSDLIFSG